MPPAVVVVAYIALSPIFRDLKPSEYGQLVDIAVLALAAVSLNLLIGFTGQISIGHSAFFGIGAYTLAILVADHGWSPGWTYPMAALICFAVGVLVGIPALRLKGLYLTLVTLALAQIFPALVRKFDGLTGGSPGIDGLQLRRAGLDRARDRPAGPGGVAVLGGARDARPRLRPGPQPREEPRSGGR